jgi:hypothetical protein
VLQGESLSRVVNRRSSDRLSHFIRSCIAWIVHLKISFVLSPMDFHRAGTESCLCSLAFEDS